MKKNILLFVILLIPVFGFTQSWDVGVELQVYPTGILPGVRIEKNFSERSATHLRLAANIFDHRALGKHKTEIGSGLGFSLGYKYYFREGHERFFLGLRNDIWFNQVEWTNEAPLTTGNTKIIVIQPTMEGGFTFVKNSWFVAPTLGFGFEINVLTNGEPTGEGAILLLGINAGHRF